jgi:hypothetical protein
MPGPFDWLSPGLQRQLEETKRERDRAEAELRARTEQDAEVERQAIQLEDKSRRLQDEVIITMDMTEVRERGSVPS